MSSTGWDTALARPKAQLSHRSCPWGGCLIKFEIDGITLQNPPAKTSGILVRPEVRAAFQEEVPLAGAKISDYTVKRPGASGFCQESRCPGPRNVEKVSEKGVLSRRRGNLEGFQLLEAHAPVLGALRL